MDKVAEVSRLIQQEDAILFKSLNEGHTGPVRVMVCRKWDVSNVNGRYMSTDFILSDEQGDVIHCVARANIAHCFIHKLLEGSVYTIKKFVVQKAKEEYKILKDNLFVIELQGSTIVSKSLPVTEGFSRYPFQLVAFEDLQPTDRKHFTDVMGYVTLVGSLTTNNSRSQSLDFHLLNERGRHVRCTLWGRLGEDLLARMAKAPNSYCIILTSMSVKLYIGLLCLSSSSSTIIYDDETIPVLRAFKSNKSASALDQPPLSSATYDTKIGSIADLLTMGRAKTSEPIRLRCVVEITSVRTKNSWYNFTCSSGKCRKGVSRKDGGFWCYSCETPVDYPRARFKLQLDVKDSTASTVIVCFDETAEILTSTTAQALLDCETDESVDDTSLPQVIRSLVGSMQTIEIRPSTYYHYGPFESFNCAKVIPSLDSNNTQSVSKVTTKTLTPAAVNDLKTPAKSSQPLKRKLCAYEDSDSDYDDRVAINPSLPTGCSIKKGIVFEDESQHENDSE